MSTIRDQAGEYAVVWVLPLAAWGAVVINGVDDVTGDAPCKLLLRVALAIAASVAAALVTHYLTVLKEVDAGTSPRFNALHASLVSGGRAAAWYAHTLTRLLDAVDHFFGDAGRAGPAGQQRLFKLRTLAPLWSAPAFDRCLLLALLYPLLTIYLFWLTSGHVGPAEKALSLPVAEFSWRGMIVLGSVTCLWLFSKSRQSTGWRSSFWLAVASAVAVAVAGTSALAFTFAFTFAGAGAGIGIGTVAGAFAGAVAFAFAFAGAVAFTFASAVAVAVEYAKRHMLEVHFYVLFWALFILLCLALPGWLAVFPRWSTSGPLLLFLGLLTLLNAPFDWLSLGLTRGLLRCGLELHGPWPWALALVDAVLAVLSIALLALVMVLGVQWFDDLAVHAGGKAILNLPALLAGLETAPGEPEYWWVYALLLSTLIPSVVNLCVASTSWLRAWPWLSRWVLQQLPDPAAPQAIADNTRYVTALVLTAQWGLGAALALCWQGALGWLLLAVLMPALGGNLLHALQAVAQHDWPGQLIAWWG